MAGSAIPHVFALTYESERSFSIRRESIQPVPIEELPLPLRQFIARYIRSVEQLEILLLLRQRVGVEWTVQEVYEIILSTPASVDRWLHELVRQGFLTPAPFRYEPVAELAESVSLLAHLYKTAPVRVIEAVYQPRPDAAQSFADAFKLKNPETPS